MRKELTNLNKTGKINDYLYYHIFNRIDYLDQNIARDLIREAQELTKMGIESEDDHKHFVYIRMHLKKIATDIAGPLSTTTIAKLSLNVYNNRNYYPIDTIPNFYKAIGRALSELDIPINKSAYPVSAETFAMKEERDVNKWIQGMREIYELIHRGNTFGQAFDIVTEHWDDMEKDQYKVWIQYYSSGEHMKYKTAEKVAQVGYHIPYDAIKVREPDMNEIRSGFSPSPIHREVSSPKVYSPTPDDAPPSTLRSGELPASNVEQINRNNVDKRIQAIIGRLRAAEKLTENSDVIARLKELLDMDVREWLGLLHKLKTSLVLVPIRHASSTILEDLIIKEANKLIKRGKVNAGRLLISIAQEPMEDTTVSNPSQSPMKTESTPTPIGTPGDVGPAPLPAQGPPPLESPPTAMPELPSAPMGEQKSDGDQAMDEFIGNLNMEYPDEADKGKADDSYADDKITVVAQEMMREPGPMVPNKLTSPVKPAIPTTPLPKPPAEIEEGPKPHIKVEEEPELDNFDLDNVRVADIVKRLEMVSNVIKNREIPRQLAIVDLMLDKLGIAAFFPTLAEATRSSLESNQYMATRVEDILGKLRGSLEHKEEVNLAPEKDESRDKTIDAVKHNLQNEDAKQKELKEQRQALRDKEVSAPTAPVKKETPKELAGPVNVEKAPPRMIPR